MRGVPALAGSCMAALALFATPVSAQPVAAAARTVLAAVVGPQGRPLVDIGLDDFVVSEGTEPREVLDVHIADYPLALVVDDRGEPADTLDVLRRAAARFVLRIGERPVALFRLSDGSRTMASLSDDRATVVARLEGLASAAAGASSDPLDTLARAATLLKDTGAPFSGVVVIANAAVDAAAPVRGELLPVIIDSGAAVHVVELLPAGEPAADAAGDDLLRVVSQQTRGQFTGIYSAASYEAALDRLADRLAIELMVQYLVPPGPKAGDVRVGVRVPGARVVGLGVK